MDLQTMINTMLGLIAFLGGWIMHSFKAQINDNRTDIKDIQHKMNEIEVLVAGKYMTREESAAQSEAIMKKLDKIQENIQSCMLHKRRKDDTCEP